MGCFIHYAVGLAALQSHASAVMTLHFAPAWRHVYFIWLNGLCSSENMWLAQSSESNCERFSAVSASSLKSTQIMVTSHWHGWHVSLQKGVPSTSERIPLFVTCGCNEEQHHVFHWEKTKPWKPCSSVLQLCTATFKPSVLPQKETFFVLVCPDCSSMASTAVKWRSPSPLSTWSAKRKRTCASNWRCAACYWANMRPYTNMHRQHLRRPLVVIFGNASAPRKISFLWIESDSSHQ